MLTRSTALIWAALAWGGCSEHGDNLEARHPEPLHCAHRVDLIRPGAEVSLPYRELSQISVDCGKDAPEDCDTRLLARACELGADAVVVVAANYADAQKLTTASYLDTNNHTSTSHADESNPNSATYAGPGTPAPKWQHLPIVFTESGRAIVYTGAPSPTN